MAENLRKAGESTKLIRGVELARNVFSKVYLYSDQNGLDIAGKQMSTSMCKNWQKELEILHEIGNKHENVIRSIREPTVNNDNMTVTLFMELCDGNLEQYIFNKKIVPLRRREVGETFAQNYFTCNLLELLHQTLLGLQHLHDYGIIHRDLKPSNVLLILIDGQKTVAKVTDFGLSKELPKDSSTVGTYSASTTAYMARECYEKRWKKSSDIFAFGILVYVAVTGGKHPFGPLELSYKIEGNIREATPPNFEHLRSYGNFLNYSVEEKITMIDMIKRLIRHKPKERLTIEEALCHPTFYSATKKVKFLKQIYHFLKKETNPKTLEQVNKFDMGLLNDYQSGKLEKFMISERDLPECFTSISAHLRKTSGSSEESDARYEQLYYRS